MDVAAPDSAPRGRRRRKSTTEVVGLIRPTVVQVSTQRMSLDTYLRPVPRGGLGSGVIIDADGVVLTNNHVVHINRPTVIMPDGRHFQGRVTGRDRHTDLAVIRVDATALPEASLGDASRLKIGEQVVAIGNALGLPGGPTVTSGVVSAVGRVIQGPAGATLYDLIQTDAAINPGNSGGPLSNMYGEVIGINTAIIPAAQGIGFAIAIDSAVPVIESLLTRGRVIRASMGVIPTTVTHMIAAQLNLMRNHGALVVFVEPGSPAARNGLRAGDVIDFIDGAPIKDETDLRRHIAAHEIGDTVSVEIVRGRAVISRSITLEEAPGA